eukprot:14655436-Alexandrium_andersonii.AAC.1
MLRPALARPRGAPTGVCAWTGPPGRRMRSHFCPDIPRTPIVPQHCRNTASQVSAVLLCSG